MQNHSAIPDDEISFFDLWQILVRRKWLVLATTLLTVVAAVVATILIKPQWEATAAIRIGAVGQIGQVGQSAQIIEPVARVVERMQLKPFEDAVLANFSHTDQNNPEAALYRNSLKVNALPDTDLVEIKIRGYSREGAKRAVAATVNHLYNLHKEMAAPTVQRMTQLLAQIEQEITQTKADQEKLLKITGLKDKKIVDTRFMENIMLANILIIQRDSELRRLEQTEMGYEEQLGPMHTYPTSLIERISVSEEPVAPKKTLIILLAGVLGLFLGIMAAFLSNAAQARK